TRYPSGQPDRRNTLADEGRDDEFFFFQAEDGIRDRNVTGVQTCALPILTLSPVVRGLSALHGGIARGLLSARYEEQQHLARTKESRAAGRAAESAALRRLERNLHDGPQQRLVRANI